MADRNGKPFIGGRIKATRYRERRYNPDIHAARVTMLAVDRNGASKEKA